MSLVRYCSNADNTTRAWKVNGLKFFVQGGNWIATDSFLLNGDVERYEAEVRLHKHAGFNLIRVWGGGEVPVVLSGREGLGKAKSG